MSLKHFHIFFVTICGLGSLGLGLWFLLTEQGAAVSGSRTMGVIALVTFVGLLVYGVKFLRMISRQRSK